MNQHLLCYIKLLLIANISRNARTLSALAKGAVSHDIFSRMLCKPFDHLISLNSLVDKNTLKGGYLVIDDTIIEKPFSEKLEGAVWAFSSSSNKCVFGYHMVILSWTDGKRKVIIDYRIYSKNSDTKIKLALGLLSYARNRLHLKPDFVLFDSWYSSKTILKRISDYGWYFITRVKKNRNFGGKKLIDYKSHPYWIAKDSLSCGLRVQIVKNGKKYFATNLMRLSKTEILSIYKLRQSIEEINKLLKFCGLNDCQSRKLKAYNTHVQCTIIAFTLLEQESRKQGCSIYSLKKDNRLSEEYAENLCKSRLKLVA
jgi:putative transposase